MLMNFLTEEIGYRKGLTRWYDLSRLSAGYSDRRISNTYALLVTYNWIFPPTACSYIQFKYTKCPCLWTLICIVYWLNYFERVYKSTKNTTNTKDRPAIVWFGRLRRKQSKPAIKDGSLYSTIDTAILIPKPALYLFSGSYCWSQAKVDRWQHIAWFYFYYKSLKYIYYILLYIYISSRTKSKGFQ